MSSPKPPRPWQVLPHHPLEQLDDNLWQISASFPGTDALRRQMHIIRLDDGRLVFHNGIPVDDATLAAIKALGTPAILIVPHKDHNLHAHAFASRLNLAVYCPAEAVPFLSPTLKVTGDYATFPRQRTVELVPLAGLKHGEAAVKVTSADGKRTHLLFADAFMNNPRTGGVAGFVSWLVGFTGKPVVAPPVFRLQFLKDKPSFKASVRKLADVPGLDKLVPSHGAVVSQGAAELLRRLTDAL